MIRKKPAILVVLDVSGTEETAAPTNSRQIKL